MTRTYGSEYHLFRNRREHPERLDAAICTAIGIPPAPLDWLYPRNLTSPGPEPEGLGFIPEVHDTWREFWPTRGSQQCWDGVAKVNDGGTPTWLLMEAKANHPEFTGSPCGARTGSDARKKIESALGKVKHHLGVHRDFSWMGSYYQFANRLGALYFLQRHDISARLIFLYVVGDCFPDNRRCPSTTEDWEELFRAREVTSAFQPIIASAS